MDPLKYKTCCVVELFHIICSISVQFIHSLDALSGNYNANKIERKKKRKSEVCVKLLTGSVDVIYNI